jgi:mono/diheme cytochrome c family protein
MRKVAALIAVLVAAGVAYTYRPTAEQSTAIHAQSGAPGAAIVDVMVPETLSQNAQIGQKAFEGNCAACHGINAVGQDGVAPPLVHKIYEPSHHGDESFQRAAAQGVQAHHWRFGNMPAVEGITRGEVTLIIAYIRELQRANGIN